MKRINGTQVLVYGSVVLLTVLVGLGTPSILLGGCWRAGRGMMGLGGMRGAWCPWCGAAGRLEGRLLGSALGLKLICLPLGVAGRVDRGRIRLLHRAGQSGSSSAPLSVTRPSCHRLAEPD